MSKGINAEGDILSMTADGRDLNDLWLEFQNVVSIRNERRSMLVELMTFPVQNVIEDVPQVGTDDFEEASEFGVPKGIRPGLSYFSLAYDFKWYDMATRFSWKFLADASSAQVEAVNAAAIEADNRLVFKKVMNSIFRNTNRTADINATNYNVYALYNADGTVPPEYKGVTHTSSHSHYLTSGNTVIDSTDIEDQMEHLRHHGYSIANGTQIILMVNPAQAVEIRKFRANTTNNNSAVATYDFVPAQGGPGLIVPNAQGLLGTQVPNQLNGMPVIGSYGSVIIIEEDYIPAGYLLMFGTGGEGNLVNPVGFREHANPSLRGLRLLGGNQVGYPLQDSYYQRGFGTGIRQRGGAVVTQITSSGTYTIPTAYAS